MGENKVKFTFLNLNNILRSGNLLLILFLNKQHVVKNIKIDKLENKLFVDLSGLLYTRKNGKRDYTISKLKYGLMPNFCPLCGRIMGKKQFDSFFWTVHKLCYDCSMKLLRKMLRLGTFELYTINYMKNKLTTTCDLAIEFYLLSKRQHTKNAVINLYGATLLWSVLDVLSFVNTINGVILLIKLYKQKAVLYFDLRLNNINKG